MNQKEFYKPTFIPLFTSALHDENITLFDGAVLGVIYWYEQLKDGVCFASNESICNVLGYNNQKSVGNCINKLDSLGYITCIYLDKNKRNRKQIIINSSKIGFHQPMVPVPSANGTLVPSYNGQKENNIEKNKEGEGTSIRDIKYLLEIPEKDLMEMRTTYKATISEIKTKGETLYNWCGANGRKYKNYRLFLYNALLRDYGKRNLDNPASML